MDHESNIEKDATDEANDWRDNAISVTKYDPQYRNPLGHFKRDDWTAISDIGEFYNDQEFTREDYLKVEEAYLSAARRFLATVGCRFVFVDWVENHISSRDLSHNDLSHLAQKFKTLQSGDQFPVEEVDDLVRAVLREVIWFKITCMGSSNAIYFGYDYYMYFYPAQLPDRLRAEIEELGLFPW